MRTSVTVFLILAALCHGSWGRLSSGLDMSYLDWEHGRNLQWGLKYSFGLELFDDVYLSARATIPVPSLIIIGNQVSYGIETTWLPVHSREGFALGASVSALRSHMWPEQVIVILADGETSEPPPVYSYESANGFGLQVLISPGYTWEDLALWLDLGIDHRAMDVERLVEGRRTDGDYDFTGPRFGISLDVFL
jgi:hypothetical protein